MSNEPHLAMLKQGWLHNMQHFFYELFSKYSHICELYNFLENSLLNPMNKYKNQIL